MQPETADNIPAACSFEPVSLALGMSEVPSDWLTFMLAEVLIGRFEEFGLLLSCESTTARKEYNTVNQSENDAKLRHCFLPQSVWDHRFPLVESLPSPAQAQVCSMFVKHGKSSACPWTSMRTDRGLYYPTAIRICRSLPISRERFVGY